MYRSILSIMDGLASGVDSHGGSDSPSTNVSNVTFNHGFQEPFSVLFYRYMFIVIYVVILAICIIGNTLVLVVTTKSARMKTRTNFFLANLAAADLCVGVLCVLPNLMSFLDPGWLLGKAMCKIYYFTESFSICVSVLLLAVIAMERYIAVMHPLKARGLFTTCRMHIAQAVIWIIAGVYNVPLLVFFDTHSLPDLSGENMTFCVPVKEDIFFKLYYTINFVLWYVLPLVTMSIVYTIISWTLWHSGSIFSRQSRDTGSDGSVTKTTPMVRAERSSGNMSSSSSSGAGSVGSTMGGNTRATSSIGGHSICSHAGFNMNGGYDGQSCICTFCSDTSERFIGNNEEKTRCCCGDSTNQVVHSKCVTGCAQHLTPANNEGLPICWSWPPGSDVERNNQNNHSRRSPYAVRSGGGSNGTNCFEMTCMNPSCPHFQRTHPKRQSVKSLNMTTAVLNPKRQRGAAPRRSFHSDCASDTSSPGHSKPSDLNTQRYQATSVRVLSSRRKVIRLLILVQVTFAVCVLPHHVRLLMNYWEVYPSLSFTFNFFPPLAFICLYLNSALNPVLYSLFSESFRRSLKELIRRPWQRWKSLTTKHDFLASRARLSGP